MKKAKLMLSAIAIFAVVGTAFAFKAKNFQHNFVFTGTSATDCTHEADGTKLTDNTGVAVFASISSTTSGCPSTFTTTTPD